MNPTDHRNQMLPASDPAQQMLDLHGVADRLQISMKAALEMLREGRLPAAAVPGKEIWTAAAIDAMVRRNMNQSAPPNP